MLVRSLCALLAALVLCAPSAARADERGAAAALARVRSTPPLLRAFLAAMPKGGDLHNHPDGAVYAERIIDWAVADGACVDATDTLFEPPCASGASPLAPHLAASGYRDRLIDALSTREVDKEPISGHDQFFQTFDRFENVESRHRAQELAETTRQAAYDHVSYLELMLTFGGDALTAATQGVRYDGDLGALRRGLETHGKMDRALAQARAQVDALERERRRLLGCDRDSHTAACGVTVRYLMQVIRALPPETVFAQTLLGFDLVKSDPLVVGINYVAPEDGPVALRDYALHMRMIAALHARDPQVPVTLHAGELTPGLVPPDALQDHIRQAVEVAGARRIGHGVDVMDERDPFALLAEMRARHILVEINLTSNDVILGVRGDAHPFPIYLAHGVPTALSTDDEGVSRIDLTHEYVRAVQTYGLGYGTLKTLARNSLEYAFLPGRSLWTSPSYAQRVAACAVDAVRADHACAAYLAANPRAAQEWRLEREFAAFEAGYPGR
jgi:adenosine deaminase